MSLLLGLMNLFIAMALKVSGDVFAVCLFLWLIAIVIEVHGIGKK